MNQPSSNNPIPVVYEDHDYIVFDKPAGLLVIPTPKKETNTLLAIVNQQYAPQGSGASLYPCHRLDRETSGLIIFARSKALQQKMMDEFKNHTIEKKYIAFIHGKLSKRQGEITLAIIDSDQKKYRNNVSPKPACTRYKVVEEKKLFSIVEVEPVTGRTNQIRIHFAKIGHPLLGDRKYSHPRDYSIKFRRAALHAYALKLKHPVTQKIISIHANLPKDMEELTHARDNH